jgi:hypothetical protein
MYSPVQVYGSRDGQQSFTALGRVKPEEPYQGQIGPGFTPFRRDVARGPARVAPIAPLRRRLVLTAGKTNQGAPFRFGLVQVRYAGRAVIARDQGATARHVALLGKVLSSGGHFHGTIQPEPAHA